MPPEIVIDEDEAPHHFMEFFSPPRVAPVLRRRGFRAYCSFDTLTGYDLLTSQDRARALRKWETHKPFFIMLSPPCTMYSKMQNLNLKKMKEDVRIRRFDEADCYLNFSMTLAKRQHRNGRFWCHEHPRDASSWRKPSVHEMNMQEGVHVVTFDQCRVGLRTPSGDKPLKKPTRLLTNSAAVQQIFSPLQCNCVEEHGVIQGSQMGYRVSTWCQVYTPQFVECLCQAVAQEWDGAEQA